MAKTKHAYTATIRMGAAHNEYLKPYSERIWTVHDLPPPPEPLTVGRRDNPKTRAEKAAKDASRRRRWEGTMSKHAAELCAAMGITHKKPRRAPRIGVACPSPEHRLAA